MSKFKITVEKVGNTEIKNEKQALQMSYDHWDEMWKAKKADLVEAFNNKELYINDHDCACCHFFCWTDCKKCVLSPTGSATHCCDGLYKKARDLFDDRTNNKWKDVKKAFKAVRDYIGEKIKELK